jgi:hypothetical protein
MNKRLCILLVSTTSTVLLAASRLWTAPKTQKKVPIPESTLEGVVIRGNEDANCPLPPKNFQISDLVGTWVAGVGDETDTLILHEDGQYKQVISRDVSNFRFESGWQKWWVEYEESGTPHVILEGMRLCVSYHLPDCNLVGGNEAGWWDFCENQIVRMPGKGILIVIGIPEQFVQPPRGIELVPLTRDPDSPGFAYQLKE